MPSRLLLPLLLLLPAPAGAASAQSCWPVGVLLALRDSSGRALAPAAVDSVAVHHGHRRLAPRAVSGPYRDASGEDPASALQLALSGCRLQLDSVTLRLDGETMTLVMRMDIDSEKRRQGSVFFLEAPPFRAGRYRLRWDPDEPGEYLHPPLIPAAGRWTRLE